MQIILGIDPGTTTTGFAVLQKNGQDFRIIDYGVLSTTPKIDLGTKLLELGTDFTNMLQKYKPDLLSIEKLFFNTNITTGIAVSHARGAMLYEAMKSGIPYLEYTPLQVKKAVTGNGKSSKLQLQNAIKMIFKLDQIPQPDDAADAIALAYMGGLNMNSVEILKNK